MRHLWRWFVEWVRLRYNCRKIRHKMKQAKSKQEWENLARLLDALEGCNEWKAQRESDFYDYQRIEKRTQMMKQLRKSDNIKTLAHQLRQDLMKNIGNISDP